MKKFKQLLCLALALTISASLLAACGQKDNGGSKDSDEKVLTYAVEGGSAGEEIALEKGWKVTTLEDQAAALMEVASGTSDAAIIDLLMAGAMIGEGTSYPDLTYTDRLTEEEYGIGCRKGSDLAQYINCVLGDAYQSGTMQKLAQQRTTMVIVTHEMAFARDVADQVIFMDGGVIVEQGEPRMVMDHPKEERTRQFLARYAQG